MKLPRDPGHHVWPSPSQEQLLKAALAQDGSAERHFLEWLQGYDIEGVVDEGTYRTLPLLWFNLAQSGVEHPLMPRLKGIFRNAWVTSQQAHALAARSLQVLSTGGIATMVSKGLPLSLDYYEKPALRPMADVDIIVPAADAERASRLLSDEGFMPLSHEWRRERALRHALSHKDSEGREIDLHWHVIYECPTSGADGFFWDSARPIRIGEARTLRPGQTELLAHVLVHGVRWNLSPPMRWIPDALMILRSHEAIDWDALCRFVTAQGLNRRVGLGLGYLAEMFAAAVPPQVVKGLCRSASIFDRLEIAAMRAPDERSAWRHVRRSAYAMRLLKSDDRSALPAALLGEIVRRSRRRLRRSGKD